MFTPLQQSHYHLHHNFVIIIIIVIVVIIVIVAIIVIIVIIVIVIVAVIIIIIPFQDLYESPVCSGYIPQAPLMRSVNKCVHNCTKLTKISSKVNLNVL